MLAIGSGDLSQKIEKEETEVTKNRKIAHPFSVDDSVPSVSSCSNSLFKICFASLRLRVRVPV